MKSDDHIAVEVRVNGHCVVCLETNCMSGTNNVNDYHEHIKMAAEWLLAFNGKPGTPFIMEDDDLTEQL